MGNLEDLKPGIKVLKFNQELAMESWYDNWELFVLFGIKKEVDSDTLYTEHVLTEAEVEMYKLNPHHFNKEIRFLDEKN